MRPRRARNAILIGLLVFLLTGSGLGFASASGPDTVFVPAPAPGDYAQYVVREVIDDEDLAQGVLDFTWARIVWLDEQTMVDETATPQFVHPARFHLMFRQGTQYESEQVRTSYHEPSSGAALMDEYRYHGEGSGTSASVCITGDACLGGAGGSEYDVTIRSVRGPNGVCGSRTPLHGALEAPKVMEVEGYCRDFRLMGDEKTTTYRLVEKTRWQDRDAVVYESAAVEGYRLTYARGIPFPVVAELPLAEHITEAYTYGRHFSLELRDFEAGSASYPERLPRVVGEPLPLVERAPDVHLDETGLIGFTLRTAFDAAMADTAEPRMADFMSRPGAYLGAAWSNQWEDADGRSVTSWTLFATDGERELGKIVSRQVTPWGVPVILDLDAVENYEVIDADYATGLDYPPRTRLPDRVPLLSAALARSTAYDGVETPNLWGFYTNCRNAGCTDVTFAVRTGEEHLPADSLALGLQGQAPESQHTVFFTHDGLLSHTWGLQAQQGSAPLIPLTSAPSGVDTREESPAEAVVWRSPAPEAVASVGFLAIVAGALYYFWPAVKALPVFGLFTRIRHDRVLENPNRARLYEAIQSEPGIHFQELGRRAEIGRGALDHHLRKLTAARLVVVEVGPGYSCYFPKGHADRRAMAAAPFLKSPGARQILAVLVADGDGTVRALSRQTGLSPSTVSHHLGRLRDAGVVAGGGRTGYQVTDMGRQAALAS